MVMMTPPRLPEHDLEDVREETEKLFLKLHAIYKERIEHNKELSLETRVLILQSICNLAHAEDHLKRAVVISLASSGEKVPC